MRSGTELDLAAVLDAAGIEYDYEPERFPVEIVKKTSYKPDFKLKNGLYIEVKGPHRHVKDSLIKLQHFVEQYPEVPLIMIACDIDHPIPRWKTMTLRKFCQKNLIVLFEVGEIESFSPSKLKRTLTI